MILEGLLTTTDDAGQVNLAPMGPRWEEQPERLVLRPFRTSRTYANLRATGRSVFHVVDDVLLLARAAIGQLEPPPKMRSLPAGAGWVLEDACRWMALEVERWTELGERTTAVCRIVDRGRIRDFIGLNRAKHAVVEAAILATRRHMIAANILAAELARLEPLISKTGGAAEQQAFRLIGDYIRAAPRPTGPESRASPATTEGHSAEARPATGDSVAT
jgi:hypothetical protein